MLKYAALVALVSCGGWPPSGNPTFADALMTENFSDYNRQGVQKVEGVTLDPNSECRQTSDCPSGQRCFWNWDSNKNVCLVQGGPHSAGCRLGGADCQPGLFCVDYEGIGTVVGCCSTLSDRCS